PPRAETTASPCCRQSSCNCSGAVLERRALSSWRISLVGRPAILNDHGRVRSSTASHGARNTWKQNTTAPQYHLVMICVYSIVTKLLGSPRRTVTSLDLE